MDLRYTCPYDPYILVVRLFKLVCFTILLAAICMALLHQLSGKKQTSCKTSLIILFKVSF